jgi:hypothetical protein
VGTISFGLTLAAGSIIMTGYVLVSLGHDISSEALKSKKFVMSYDMSYDMEDVT